MIFQPTKTHIPIFRNSKMKTENDNNKIILKDKDDNKEEITKLLGLAKNTLKNITTTESTENSKNIKMGLDLIA